MDIKKSGLFTHPIAHRGLHDSTTPENSLLAYQKAIDAGYAIEIDVRPIDDGTVVVFHDDNLKRLCGIDKEIARCTFTEIRELYLKHTHERIPLLSEVLALINGKVPLLIELKYDQPAGKLEAATLEVLRKYKGKYALQSFSPLALRWLKKNAPDVPRGQLASNFKDYKDIAAIVKPALKNLWLSPLSRPDFISYDIRALPNKRVEKLRASGTPVLGWTVSKISESQEALKHCDNLICEEIL